MEVKEGEAYEVCSTCIFFHKAKAHPVTGLSLSGECHRYPPVVIYDKEDKIKDTAFPDVTLRNWCGEWVGLEQRAN